MYKVVEMTPFYGQDIISKKVYFLFLLRNKKIMSE